MVNMIINEKLINNNLHLRSLTLDDCKEQYVYWLNDIEVNKYLETRFTFQNIEMIKSFVAAVNESKDSYLFGIFINEVHIGNIKIGPIHPIYKFADISYFIGDKDCWGKGYTTLAIKLITEFGFNTIGLNRIQAGVHGSNIGSQKVLEKCGYKKEALLRKKIYYGCNENKVWDDHLYFGILKEEYPPPLII